MKNIISAQLYQARHSRILRTIVLSFSAMTVLFAVAIWSNGGEAHLKSSEICAMLLSIISTFITMMAVIVTAILCGDDFTDRTINHELTSGVLRRDAYFGRAAVAVTTAVVLSVMQYLLMFAAALVLGREWGYELSVAGLFQRILLIIPVLIRLCCFNVFLCSIVKKPVGPVVLFYGLLLIESVAKGDKVNRYSELLTSLSSMNAVVNLNYHYTFALHGSGMHMVCEPYVAAPDAVKIAAVSLIAAAVYLTLGYSFFHRDDMR